METHVMAGHTLRVTCRVDAFPAPTLTILKGRESVQTGERVTISGEADPDDPTKFKLNLVIAAATPADGGRYSCHANNTIGEDSAVLGINVTAGPQPGMDVRDCCRQQNVSADCLDVCSFTVDFDAMLRKPQCLPEFHKLMMCAADGSDHRHCCSKGSVPAECLDWCRGEPVAKTDVCALSHSKTIIGCFSEGRSNLPGPPRNIKVRPINKSSAIVSWDAPEKNSGAVELYRVFWRPLGAKAANKTDTTDTKLMLDSLNSGTTYELVVKAGNSNGTSVLTSPLKFITADEYIIATTAQQSGSSSEAAGVVVAVIVVLIVIGVLILVLYVMKKKNIVLSVKKPDSPTVAFENPFYSSRESSSHPAQVICFYGSFWVDKILLKGQQREMIYFAICHVRTITYETKDLEEKILNQKKVILYFYPNFVYFWSFQATVPLTAIAFCILFDKLLNAVVKHYSRYVVGRPSKSSAYTARLSETLHWYKNLWASSTRQPTTNTGILST
jgi:hypothetical protein